MSLLVSPSISVVLCTHNRAAYLEKALRSLAAQTLPRSSWEAIVVDNCSTDHTRRVAARFAEEMTVVYVYEPILGLSHARNAGWRDARAPLVAYLDDDAVAVPDWLERILEAFTTVTPRPGCVGGRVDPIWEAPRPRWLSDEVAACLTVVDWTATPHPIPDLSQEWLVGANLAVPRDVLERLGGFTNGLDRAGKSLLSSGDVFLQKQIQKLGLTCYYHPAMAVGHHVPAARLHKPWFRKRYYWQGVSDAVMQLLEERPGPLRRPYLAVRRLRGLLRHPSWVAALLLPTNQPTRFTDKCWAWIAVGHIFGLLGAARR
jgi:glycosyltransferase involved in cell wall biosynthesis